MKHLFSLKSLILILSVSLAYNLSYAQKLSKLKKATLQEVEGLRDEVQSMAESLWQYSETALFEHKSCNLLISKLENAGFTIEKGVADMPTAFVASYGQGQPIIGILAEYDALPGVGNAPAPEKKGRDDGITSGHGCGHNLFGAATVGSAIAIKQIMEKQNLKGTIRLYGCPAEETVIGKVYMAKAGLFDDLDAALHWHPSTETQAWNRTGNAMNNFSVEFYGISAHGAADPWNGRSALDAVELMNYGVNLMREHVEPTTRIHYVIPNAGEAPNVVPSYAKVWYYVRDITRDKVEKLYDRLLKIAEGAAMATETEFKVSLFTGVHEVLSNEPLLKEIQTNMELLGPIQFTEEEQQWAKTMQKASGKEEVGLKGEIKPLKDEIPGHRGGGSTDVAEVSYITPTSGFSATSAPFGIPWHSWQASASHGTSIGHKSAQFATKLLAITGIEMLTNEKLLEAAKSDFKERTKGEPYKCPIPQDQKPPLPDTASGN
ncbi:amidohydrolase [Fulvivirgaceae bacterium BMA10]|uniref:Amidohydrolase n=1 Tax=Splendidivirga corallicola TaxID=3051826 RepID=A0ABT8KP43_9BACT|nr:amidohydrolase [Fulvivirgaceae bacterium BMA10]